MATDTLVSSGTNTFATSPQVSDKVYAADYAVPTALFELAQTLLTNYFEKLQEG